MIGPDGKSTTRHDGYWPQDFALPIYARTGGSYLIKFYSIRVSDRQNPTGSYVIGLAAPPPVIKKRGQIVKRSINDDDMHAFRVDLKAGESINLELTCSRPYLGFEIYDPTGTQLKGPVSSVGTSVAYFFHAKISGPYLIKVSSGFLGGNPINYEIKAGTLHPLQRGSVLELTRAENLYVIKLKAGQVLRAELVDAQADKHGFWAEIQDTGDNVRRLIWQTTSGHLSTLFIAGTTGEYGIRVKDNRPQGNPKRKLYIKELKDASAQDKIELANRSCSWNPIGPEDGFRELLFANECFYGVSHLVADQHPDIIRLASRMNEDITFMTGRWDGSPLSSLYLESLDLIRRGLLLALSTHSRKRVYTILREIAADIRIKAEHCRRSESGLGNSIKLIVTTTRDGVPVTGYSVFCVPRMREFDKTRPPIPFDRLSNPEAEVDLPPSRYIVWGEKSENQRMLEKNDVELSFGDKPRKLSIRVP